MKNKMPQYLERKMGTSTAQVEIGSGQSGVLDALNSSGLLHVVDSRGPSAELFVAASAVTLPW